MSEHDTALVVAQEPQIIAWKTPETLRLIKSVYAKDCSDQEFGLFVEVAASLGLSPLKRQIYAIKRGDKLTIQVGIDGFRAIAERSGLYAGQIGPQWCGKDGEWKDVWTDDLKDLIAARVGVLRRDFKQPIWGVARVAAYRQQSNPLWNTMPDVLAARSAEALALRKTFPDLLSGVYTHDEMGQADNDTPYVDATPTAQHTPVTRQEAQQHAKHVRVAEDDMVSQGAVRKLLFDHGYTTAALQDDYLATTLALDLKPKYTQEEYGKIVAALKALQFAQEGGGK